MDGLYQEVILDHYRNPRSRGLREPFDAEVRHRNPTCGDEVTLRVRVTGDGPGAVLTDVSYAGQGCSISQASASVLTELVTGEPVRQAARSSAGFLGLMRGAAPDAATADSLDDAMAFAGVAQYPARVKCALLPWMALRDALLRAGVDPADLADGADQSRVAAQSTQPTNGEVPR